MLKRPVFIDGDTSRHIRIHALNVRVETFAYPVVISAAGRIGSVSMRVVPRELIDDQSRPGICNCIPGRDILF